MFRALCPAVLLGLASCVVGASTPAIAPDAVLAHVKFLASDDLQGRGNGSQGEGVTENIKTIASVPLRLREAGRPAPEMLAVRGEVMMHISEFEAFNERLKNRIRAASADVGRYLQTYGGVVTKDPESDWMNIRFYILILQFMAYILVIFPVIRVSRITFF